jgi:type I restriction enzyme R subunit
MNTIGKPERATQRRVIALFRDELGYRYLGDWSDRDGNSNIEEGLLRAYLTGRGYSAAQISRAIYQLRTEANNPNRSLYTNNQAVYGLLHYGVPMKLEAGKPTETVHLSNWRARAERLRRGRGGHAQRRPRAPARRRAVSQRHRHWRA